MRQQNPCKEREGKKRHAQKPAELMMHSPASHGNVAPCHCSPPQPSRGSPRPPRESSSSCRSPPGHGCGPPTPTKHGKCRQQAMSQPVNNGSGCLNHRDTLHLPPFQAGVPASTTTVNQSTTASPDEGKLSLPLSLALSLSLSHTHARQKQQR